MQGACRLILGLRLIAQVGGPPAQPVMGQAIKAGQRPPLLPQSPPPCITPQRSWIAGLAIDQKALAPVLSYQSQVSGVVQAV